MATFHRLDLAKVAPRSSDRLSRRARTRLPILAKAVMNHPREPSIVDAAASPSEGLNFILKCEAACLAFAPAKVEVACKSWPSAWRRCWTARLLWLNNLRGGGVAVDWLTPSDGPEAEICGSRCGAVNSGPSGRSIPALGLLIFWGEVSGGRGIGYR